MLALTEDAEITRSISWFRKNVPLLVNCSFDHTLWNKCRLSQKRRPFTDPSWRKEVVSTLKQHNFCSFVFKRHIVKPLMSTRENAPACEGRCNFSMRPVCFVYTVDDDIQGEVRFQG